MKVLAKAFIEFVDFMEIAKFDDPDEAQAAEQVISWCFVESSDEEKAMLCQVASENIAELRAKDGPQSSIEFYERIIASVTAA